VAQYIVDISTRPPSRRRGARPPREHVFEHVVRFSQALGSRLSRAPAAARDEYRRRAPDSRHAHGGAAVSLDQTEFEAALAADHVNVEDTAHKLSRSR